VAEYRIDYGPGYRLYLGQDGTRLIILLIGGNKGGQDNDIQEAITLGRDAAITTRSSGRTAASDQT